MLFGSSSRFVAFVQFVVQALVPANGQLRNSAFIGGSFRIWIEKERVFPKASRTIVVSPYSFEGVRVPEGVTEKWVRRRKELRLSAN
jgi:hypothetical protein